jgi:DNA-binding response OmpR family regulator
MESGTVLIIEDDATMRRVLKDNFEFSGYTVHTAADGKQGLQAVFELKPDLIILDIMLPIMNGYDLCCRIRRNGLTIPIIMLTAKGQESDVVFGLNLGADDYVTKPFSIEVLLARANTCLRRQHSVQTRIFEFGDCRLDCSAHKLFRHNQEVFLTPKEFRLLEYMVQNADRALTRERILDHVWGDEVIVTQRSVDRCINTLRNKIEPDPQSPLFIRTIRDVGYRFEVPEGNPSCPGGDSA